MEQAVNQFVKGLQLDTHPMVQGNDTLSDCLNGTFITMNGNEMILQNDMGNRRVDNAYLPNGYEPVGIKEYGGIIYLALYNPVTNKSQLGSFPSPERIINDSTNTEGISINFYDVTLVDDADSNFSFLKSTSKLIPLSPDNIRAGDKFTIWTNSLSGGDVNKGTLSHYGNVLNDKVVSPKNKEYTLRIGVLNSQNEFVDITNSLQRYAIDSERNTTEERLDLSDKTDLYKQNAGYFIQQRTKEPEEISTNSDKTVIAERQAIPLNTYAYKLVGPLYANIIYNTIQNFNYDIQITKEGEKTDSDGKVTEGTAILTIIGEITYNCPDGVINGGDGDENYTTYAEGKVNDTLKSFDLWYKNGAIYEKLNPAKKSEESSEDNIDYGDCSYDLQTNLYTVRIAKTYNIPYSNFVNGTLNYFIGVYSGLTKEDSTTLYLKTLSDYGSIEWDKIQSGGINLDYWRYYVYDEHTFDLTYRFSSYPKYNQQFKDLKITFEAIDMDSSAANSKSQSELVDDDGNTISKEQSLVTSNAKWDTIITSKDGVEYTLLGDETTGYTIVDKNGNEYSVTEDTGSGYVVVDKDGKDFELDTADGYVISHRYSSADIVLAGDYKVYLDGQQVNSEQNELNYITEDSTTDDSTSSSSSNEITFDLQSTITNGKVTYHFSDIENRLPTDKKGLGIMFKVTLKVTEVTEGENPQELPFYCFLLNTKLFNNHYSPISTQYVPNFLELNNEKYRDYLKVNINLDSSENVRVIESSKSYSGSPIVTTNSNINYVIHNSQKVEVTAEGQASVESGSLYPNYIALKGNIHWQPEADKTADELYYQIDLSRWGSESRPTQADMINIDNPSGTNIFNIDNYDRLVSNNVTQKTFDIQNMFIPVYEAFQEQFRRELMSSETTIKDFSGIVIKTKNSGNDRTLQVMLHNTKSDFTNAEGDNSPNGEIHDIAEQTKQGEDGRDFNFSKYQDDIFDKLNSLTQSFVVMFLGITNGDDHYKVTFNNNFSNVNMQRDLGTFEEKPISTMYDIPDDSEVAQSAGSRRGRVWWKCYDGNWVLLTHSNQRLTSFDAKSTLLRYQPKDIEDYQTYLKEYFRSFYDILFNNYTDEFYVCYYKNTSKNMYTFTGDAKYNKAYNLVLGFSVKYSFTGSLTNQPEAGDYHIPQFTLGNITSPNRYVGYINIDSDNKLFNIIENPTESMQNFIMDGNNIYFTDSKGENLSFSTIYQKNDLEVISREKNPFRFVSEDNDETRQILCNSYLLKQPVGGNSYRYDFWGPGEGDKDPRKWNASLIYDKVPQIVP